MSGLENSRAINEHTGAGFVQTMKPLRLRSGQNARMRRALEPPRWQRWPPVWLICLSYPDLIPDFPDIRPEEPELSQRDADE